MEKLTNRIEHIKNLWFMKEPAYYIMLCMNKIEFTDTVHNIACGNGAILFKESFFDDVDDDSLEEYIKIECIRIFLKHPYQRKLPNLVASYIASNIVIGTLIPLKHVKLVKLSDILINEYNSLDSYEGTYKKIIKAFPKSNNDGVCDNTSNNGDTKNDSHPKPLPQNMQDDMAKTVSDIHKNMQQWDEDDIMINEINKILNFIDSTKQWGSICNDIKEKILAEDVKRFNYSNILKMFRASIISGTRCMTRMKPSRRFGYIQMGSRSEYTTNILVICDTSGSITEKHIAKLLGFVGGFFRCGVISIDMIQFDIKVYDKTLQRFTKSPKFIQTVSRGGTNVNDIITYVNERSTKKYDGCIIITDGFFDYDKNIWTRKNLRNTKYLWCVNDKYGYDKLKDKIDSSSRIMYMDILENNI
jgi:predicted metal-dependent peptidase